MRIIIIFVDFCLCCTKMITVLIFKERLFMRTGIYKTRHRDDLMEYFETTGSDHFTVSDVCEYFRQKNEPIGTATVYRQLEKMVTEGILNKYIIDANSPACFQYIGSHEHCHEDVCYHCKCEKCGKLIHLHCEEIMSFAKHLETEHSFVLDPRRTVFYGICAECAGKQ